MKGEAERADGERSSAERGTGAPATPRTLCLIPAELAKLGAVLERHYEQDAVEVLVDQRGHERRSDDERRQQELGPPAGANERRKIRNPDGRRVGERRAALVPVDPPSPLPRKARAYADRTVFAERVTLSAEQAEDADTARLVTRIQAGDEAAFVTLYSRYFGRVYGYLRTLLKDAHEAEDAAQEVFMKVLGALPDYERRPKLPFRAWLFTIVRNYGIRQAERQGRVSPMEPEDVDRHHERLNQPDGAELRVLNTISDPDLVLFIRRLPVAQREVLALRFIIGLSVSEISEVLGRSPSDIRKLQSRALLFLRDRLQSVGRDRPTFRRDRSLVRCPKQASVLRWRRFALMGW